jgi:hypothetical protein
LIYIIIILINNLIKNMKNTYDLDDLEYKQD